MKVVKMKRNKICLVSFCNLYMTPYIKYYVDCAITVSQEIDILFWDRDGKMGEGDGFNNINKICFNKKTGAKENLFCLLIKYFKCASFFKSAIKKHNYSKIVFLQSHGCVFCYSILKLFKKRYIIDIRDFSVENVKFLFNLEKKAINNSCFSVISSPAFTRFLPDGEYVVSHNYNQLETKNVLQQLKKQEPIHISFIGTIRFFEMDKKLIDSLKNDKRYVLDYFGKNSEILKDYCEQNDVENVSFLPMFNPNELTELYSRTNLINNLYGYNDRYLDFAISNKLYHAIQLKLPILVCKNTYMAELVSKYSLGLIYDFDNERMPDVLYNWYINFDFQEFSKKCDELINQVKECNSLFETKIKNFMIEGVDNNENFGNNI